MVWVVDHTDLTARIYDMGKKAWEHFAGPLHPAVMQGDLNVAVAGFSEVDESGHDFKSAVGVRLAPEIATALEGRLTALTKEIGVASEVAKKSVQVWPPEKVRHSISGTLRIDDRTISDVARAIHANLVLYGTIVHHQDGTIYFVPKIFISPMEETLEISGSQFLGPPKLLNRGNFGIITARDAFDQVSSSVDAFVRFIVGLEEYSNKKYTKALAHFQQAASGTENPFAITYLLLGNTASRLGKPNDALTYYQAALRIDPAYGRARLGLGGVLYGQAMHDPVDCQPAKADLAMLENSAEYYRKATAPDALRSLQPNEVLVDDIETRSGYYLGEVYGCMSNVGLQPPRWQEAIQLLTVVAAHRHRSDNRHLDEIIQAAHATLGNIYAEMPEPQRDLETAIQQYLYALSDLRRDVDPYRRGFYDTALAKIYARHGDCAKARDTWGEAVKDWDESIRLARAANDSGRIDRYTTAKESAEQEAIRAGRGC